MLKKVGFTENELKVYEVIVAFGFRTVGQICSYTSLSMSDVSSVCLSLQERNFLKIVKGKTEEATLYLPLVPKISISGDVSKKLSANLKKLSSNVSELWENTQITVDDDTSKLVNTVIESSETNKNSLIETLETHKKSIKTIAGDFRSSLQNMTIEATNSFQNRVNNPLKELSKSISDNSQFIGEISSNSINSMKESNESHSDSIIHIIPEIKSQLIDFSSEIGSIMDDGISKINKKLEPLSSKSTEDGEQIIIDMKRNIDEIIIQENDKVASYNETLPSGILDEYTTNQENLKSAHKQIATKFNELVDASIFAGEKAKDESADGTKQIISEFKTGQSNKINKLEKDLLVAIQTVQTEAVNQLSEVLKQTSTELSSLEESITTNLNSNNDTLKGDLTKLKTNLTKSLNTRFKEVADKLANFINDLKQTSEENVTNSIDSIVELKEFLRTFLAGTQSNLNNQLDSLQSSVETELGEILSKSNENIKKSINKNDCDTNKIKEKAETNLTDFQTSLDEFLNNVKLNLQDKLESAQNNFKQGVDAGVEIYESESAKVKKDQALQIKEINSEAKALSNQGEKSKKDLENVAEKVLSDNKDETISNIEDNVESGADKFSREFTRFNERLETELKGFYTNFHDQSTGMRDQIPQSIERLFVDQMDKMENFRRDFQRIMGHTIDTLNSFMKGFSSDGKKFKVDKKEVPQLFGDVSRSLSDFQSFEGQLVGYFKSSIEDVEDTKDELLSIINKTIQDELTGLEELVEEKSNETKNIAGSFLNSLNKSVQGFVDDMKKGINEPIENLQSNISSQLVSKFQQPLNSILSKAQYLATGTEGVEKENRILLTQQILIEKIQESVNKLVESLNNAYEESIEDLDSQVETSIATSNEIVTTLKSNVKKSFTVQKKSVKNFAADFKKSLDEVQNSINTTLNDSLSSTKSDVEETLNTKSGEVEEEVTSKTELLSQATTEAIVEVDQSLVEFNKEFDAILKETSTQVKSTVSTTTKSQAKNLKTALKTLNTTTSKAQEILNNTQISLNDNVGQALSNIETEVKTLASGFNDQIDKSEGIIVKQIDKYYSGSKKHLTELASYKKSMDKNITTHITELESLGENITQGLNTKVNEYTEKLKESLVEFNSSIDLKLQGLSENNSKFILDTFDSISTQFSALQSDVSSSLDDKNSKIDAFVTNAVETIKSDILNATGQVIESLEKERDGITSKLTDLSQIFNEFDNSQDEQFNTSKDKLVEKIESSIETNSEKWTSKIEEDYQDQLKKLSDIATIFEKNIKSVSTSGKKSISEAIQNIPSIIEKTLEEATESMALLSEILKGSIALDVKPPELSYFDASAEAIISNLNAVLSRSKSNVTIVAPTISWLDEELIPKFTRVTVRIISDLEQHTPEDTKLIKKFEEAGVNMSLRKLDRNRYRGDIDMIMAIRDKEEVILAKLPKSPNPYAFVSQDEQFVDKFTELFAPFYTMPSV